MKKYIAILRGINVGGKRKILIKDLKLLFERMGFSEVTTYIQSGNVIFCSNKEQENSILEEELQEAIFETYGFEVPVIIRTPEELNKAISQNPFYQKENIDIKRLHLTFLRVTPATEALVKTARDDHSPDEFLVTGNHVFIYCAGKYHQSKLSNKFFESKLKIAATTRNWKTVLKLQELS
ncbi:hypothetical protein GCM10007103_04820 [Salinimicrobium marinum]|uniref:DUF1697 domain-containing protein n=1 Tax=Salinimicrobium marinum TaxID=680283 RepID=A0A918VVA6_9FLAO|nr:DUF1697 domain-containing protein [Salinimicrobium marinum]GHA26488.1 hypothetical protein GCM10007103_04820 [Salinimicrobium marinum]